MYCPKPDKHNISILDTDETSALLIEVLKEKYSNNAAIIKEKQAEFDAFSHPYLNIENFIIFPRKSFQDHKHILTGKEKRREKRNQIRLNK